MSTRWKIEKDWAVTECETDHPMRLPRNHPMPLRTDHSERAEALRAGKTGYWCKAPTEHWYPIWVVVDTTGKDLHDDSFSVYAEAVAYRNELNAQEGKAK